MSVIPKIINKFKPYITYSGIHPSHPNYDYQIIIRFENGYGCLVGTGFYAVGNIEVLPLKMNVTTGTKIYRNNGRAPEKAEWINPEYCSKEFGLACNSDRISFKDDRKLNEWLEVLYSHKN